MRDGRERWNETDQAQFGGPSLIALCGLRCPAPRRAKRGDSTPLVQSEGHGTWALRTHEIILDRDPTLRLRNNTIAQVIDPHQEQGSASPLQSHSSSSVPANPSPTAYLPLLAMGGGLLTSTSIGGQGLPFRVLPLLCTVLRSPSSSCSQLLSRCCWHFLGEISLVRRPEAVLLPVSLRVTE
jgi:hypothetical protein